MPSDDKLSATRSSESPFAIFQAHVYKHATILVRAIQAIIATDVRWRKQNKNHAGIWGGSTPESLHSLMPPPRQCRNIR